MNKLYWNKFMNHQKNRKINNKYSRVFQRDKLINFILN